MFSRSGFSVQARYSSFRTFRMFCAEFRHSRLYLSGQLPRHKIPNRLLRSAICASSFNSACASLPLATTAFR